MFTTKFYVRQDRSHSLMLRIFNNHKKSELSMGIQIDEADFADAMSPNPKSKNIRFKLVISQWQNTVDGIKLELSDKGEPDLDPKEIKRLISHAIFGTPLEETSESPDESKPGEFVTWFCKFADTHNSPGTRTKKDYYHTLSRLKSYKPEIDKLDFRDITVGWLEGFDEFLASTCKVNSRNHHMRNIRAVFKYAIRHDLDIRNPFDRMRLKTEETEKRSLSVEELREVFTMDVLPYSEIYRDMFKLTFMLIGINPIDLYRLKEISSRGRIDYRRAKTHKLYSIKVEPEAKNIIEKYRGAKDLLMLSDRWMLPDSFGAAANKALRNLGEKPSARGRKRGKNAKFPNLTLYWARHTWATIASELDIPDATISLALGHAGENVTTNKYIRRNQKKVDEANRRVLDWVLYGKR